MGVRGLLSFTERKCPEGSYEVDLRQLARAKLHQGIAPVIIVDLYNVVQQLYGDDLDWICGGQFKQYNKKIQIFISCFKNAGIELVWVVDGALDSNKRETFVRRRYENMRDLIYPTFDALKRGEFPRSRDKEMPCLMSKDVLRYLLGVKVLISEREADTEISSLARKHKAIGILAYDSDYLIYQSGVPLLSIRDLDWDRLTTRCFNAAGLADQLGLPSARHLPMFALLAGNDVMTGATLAKLHHRLGGGGLYGERLFYAVVELMQYYSLERERSLNRLKGLLPKAILDTMRQGLKEYFLEYTPNQEPEGLDSDWKQILQILKDKCYTWYAVMIGQPLNQSGGLQDYRESYTIPPHGLLWASSRQRLYGVLLKEKPGAFDPNTGLFSLTVEEWVMNGPETLDSPCMVEPILPVNHPGLVSLHTGTGSQVQHEKWKLFAWVIDPRLNHEKLQALKPEEVGLFVILYKMQHEREKPVLLDWEVKVFILVFCLLQILDAEHLYSQLEFVPTPRGTQLVTLFARDIVLKVSRAVGDPIQSPASLLPHNWTDGVLFQQVYGHGPDSMASAATVQDMIHYFLDDQSKDEKLELFSSTFKLFEDLYQRFHQLNKL